MDINQTFNSSNVKVKAKKCKGVGKGKGRGCGTITKFRHYGLCDECYKDWLLNTSKGREKLIRATRIGHNRSVKEQNKVARQKKLDLIEYKPKLQNKINEIIRLIDIGQPCLARGVHANQIHAGHVYSRGSNPTMKYNLHNIHRQSAQSNHFQNEDGLLREGLIKEYGQEYMNFLSELRRTPALKYTNNEYREFFNEAKKIALYLKKNGKTFDLKKRIEIRNKINLKLNIYEEQYCLF